MSNPFAAERAALRTELSTVCRHVTITPPEIISPGMIVIQQGTYLPGEVFGTLLSTVDLDVLVERCASFEQTQAAIDQALDDIIPTLLNWKAEITEISAPFNVQDAEGTLLPAVTVTITHEITL